MLTHDQRAAAEAPIQTALTNLLPNGSIVAVKISNRTPITDDDTGEQIELPPVAYIQVKLPSIGVTADIPEALAAEPQALPVYARMSIAGAIAHELRQLANRIDGGQSLTEWAVKA